MKKRYQTPKIRFQVVEPMHMIAATNDGAKDLSAKQYEFTDDSESTDETSWATPTDNGANIWDK